MADSAHYDLIIIGAGAAGMSLLLTLQKNQYQGRVLVLESEDSYPTQRTWSFWLQPDFPDHLRPLIAHQWTRWAFSHRDRECIHHSEQHPYCVIRGDDFFRLADAVQRSSDRVTLRFGCPVLSTKNTSVFELSTPQGVVSAKKVVDTRLSATAAANNALWQCFYGMEITTSHYAFDSTQPQLMQGLRCTDFGLEFFYILPFDRYRALVEFTCFSDQKPSLAELRSRLLNYLNDSIRGGYTHSRTEHGFLPMFAISPKNELSRGRQWVQGGIAGGAMRAATGYCFQPIQRWAAVMAQSLCRHNRLADYRPIPVTYRWMDKLFLSVIQHEKSLADSLFYRLAEGTNGESFARFMSESASLGDFAKVIGSMPKTLFLKQLTLMTMPNSPQQHNGNWV